MSGDIYITWAAFILDSRLRVTIYYEDDYYLREYKYTAGRNGESVATLYGKRNPGETTQLSEEEVVKRLSKKSGDDAEYMRNVLNLAVPYRDFAYNYNPNDTINQNPIQVVQGRMTGETNVGQCTSIVADGFRSLNIDLTRMNLLVGLFWNMSEPFQQQIQDYYKSVGLVEGKKYLMLWGRSSGEKTGAATWLDTNDVMLAQITQAARKHFPDRTIITIGDPVFKLRYGTASLDNPSMEQFYGPGVVDLSEYWNRGFPKASASDKMVARALNMQGQMYFLNLLRVRNDCLAIGNESGIIELPALLGMPTVYLENIHLSLRKGLRWDKMTREVQNFRCLETQTAREKAARKIELYREIDAWLRGEGDPKQKTLKSKEEFVTHCDVLAKTVFNAARSAPEDDVYVHDLDATVHLIKSENQNTLPPHCFSQSEKQAIILDMHSDLDRYGLTEKEVAQLLATCDEVLKYSWRKQVKRVSLKKDEQDTLSQMEEFLQKGEFSTVSRLPARTGRPGQAKVEEKHKEDASVVNTSSSKTEFNRQGK